METNITKTEFAFPVELGGKRFAWAFRFPETPGYLRRWLGAPLDAVPPDALRVTDDDFAAWDGRGITFDAFGEYNLICIPTSEAMMPDGCVFHAAAVRFRGRAFLIAAGSGVGKTTQVRTLQELYPGEVGIISGDKPVLAFREDGSVTVHPSPWNGKEDLYGADAAPLGGIFLLRRGEENSVVPMTAKEAAPFTLLQIFQSCADREAILRAGKAAETLLKSAPLWRMTNKGVPDSTRLMYETMLQEATEHGV